MQTGIRLDVGEANVLDRMTLRYRRGNLREIAAGGAWLHADRGIARHIQRIVAAQLV
jgi:hypothetical protein